MAISSVQNVYAQGNLVTLTTTTLNEFGQPQAPDNNVLPIINISFETPGGPQPIINNGVMIPATTSFYYYNVDTTYLGVGTYVATISWIVNGMQSVFTPNFSIIPFSPNAPAVLDPISKLRIMLKDNDEDPTRWIWSDLELSTYLGMSLDAWNSAPPRTSSFWFNIPMQYIMNIILYAQYLALQAKASQIASQPIQYSDKGLTVDKFRQAQTYMNFANTIREQAEAERLRQKRQFAYHWGFIITPNMPYLSNIPLRAWNINWTGL